MKKEILSPYKIPLVNEDTMFQHFEEMLLRDELFFALEQERNFFDLYHMFLSTYAGLIHAEHISKSDQEKLISLLKEVLAAKENLDSHPQ